MQFDFDFINYTAQYFIQQTKMINHVPVMLSEVLDSIPTNSKIVVDGTLWHGWHSTAILEKFPNIQKLYWLDLDPNIFTQTQNKMSKFSDKTNLVQSSYIHVSKILWDQKADFVLLDLWVNMEHFKDASRGFSINQDSKLDMRFDNQNWQSAYNIINQYSISDLAQIFINYAEFSQSKANEIAQKIIETRKNQKIETTFQLKQLLNQLGLWQKASTVIFQAIRIETNKEMDNLKLFLDQIPDILSIWWSCGIITFHSIEDRIVKNYFKELSKTQSFQLLHKKAQQASYLEVQSNRASRSAKYRVIQKIL